MLGPIGLKNKFEQSQVVFRLNFSQQTPAQCLLPGKVMIIPGPLTPAPAPELSMHCKVKINQTTAGTIPDRLSGKIYYSTSTSHSNRDRY